MLWIGLHLPALSLESFAATVSGGLDGPAMALMDAHHIVHANARAQAMGVEPGLKRATALALAPGLLLGQADPLRDAQALLSVAHAALAFTPTVCLSPPDGVLLEVQASLRYFGGREALLRRLREQLAPLGHRLQIASAPTALGARWLSLLQDGLDCPHPDALRRRLDAAPWAVLGCATTHGEVFRSMGLNHLGALRRLPRGGLARRFGPSLLTELDCAYGLRADPREPVQLPPAFDSQLELFARADTTEQLLHGAQVLLTRLVTWLSARHAFVRRFELRMKHEPRWRRETSSPPHTVLEISLAEPSREAAHLLVLLRERLAALHLPAPTLELSLHAHDLSQQPPPNEELFPTPRSEREGVSRLIERLQARLGREQIRRLVPVADHRPEKATLQQPVGAQGWSGQGRVPASRAAAGAGVPSTSAWSQPVWLLDSPQWLPQEQALPLLDGRPLYLLAGPDRVESGWWDGDLIERDYFIAQAHDGALLWVYRTRFAPTSAPAETRGGEGWFLHGRFG